LARAAAGSICLLVAAVSPALALDQAFAPCQTRHDDAGAYHAALAEAGWRIAARSDRAPLMERLADGFLPDLSAAIPADNAALSGFRKDAASVWTRYVADRPLFLRDDVLLLIAGYVNDAGQEAVQCWAVSSDPALTDAHLNMPETPPDAGFHRQETVLDGQPGADQVKLSAMRLMLPYVPDPPLLSENALIVTSIFPSHPE